MHRRMRRIVLAAIAAASLTAPSSAPAGHLGPDLTGALAEDCVEFDAVVRAPQERLRPYVPPEYILTQFPPDSPTTLTTHADMLLRVFNCERQTLGGRTRHDVTHALFGPAVLPTRGAATPNTPTFSFYTWFWVSDNPDFVRWARSHTMDAAEVVYVPGLRYRREVDLAGNIRHDLKVPSPSPSPFNFWTQSGPTTSRPFELRVHWWMESGGATWSVVNTVHRMGTITTAQGGLVPKPGSQMDIVVGDDPSHGFCCNQLTGSTAQQFINATFDEQLTTSERVITP